MNTTNDLCLAYDGNKYPKIELEVYVDSDFGGTAQDRRSTTGYAIKMAGGVIDYVSKKQPNVTLSSAEAEYVAACSVTQSVMQFRSILNELGFSQEKPTLIHEDNQSCITISSDYVTNGRTRNIDIKYHYVRDRMIEGILKWNTFNQTRISRIYSQRIWDV